MNNHLWKNNAGWKTVCLSLVILSMSSFAQAADWLSVPAKVYSKNNIMLSSEIDGRIDFIRQAGERFSKDEMIVSIDDRFERRVRGLYKQQLRTAQQQVELRQEQLQSYESLSASSSLSQEQKNDKLNEYLEAQRQVTSLEIKIAELDYAIQRKQVFATWDGVVLDKLVSKGETVANQTPMLNVLYAQTFFAGANIPFSQLHRIDTTEAWVEQEIEGVTQRIEVTLDYVGSDVDAKTNTVFISYRLANADVINGQNLTLNIQRQ